MTKVFKIRNDVNRYRYFLCDNVTDAVEGVLEGNCRPKTEDWTAPPLHVPYPMKEEGDFYQFSLGSFITGQRATDALYSHLTMAGELLPLFHDGREYSLLNVTECVNCLDHERSEWLVSSEGRRMYPTKYAFHPNRWSESQIFKLPETHLTEVLLVEHDDGGELEPFRGVVERSGLKGLLYEELWNDEG